MRLDEKLQLLTANMTLSKLARSAKISRAALTKYRAGCRPGIDAAVAIAKTLGVDAGWLIDDAKGWPPIRCEELQPSAA